MPVVTVLIANWNGCDILRDALRSVYGTTSGVTFELVVVDDASTDGSVSMIRGEFPQVRLIVNPVNVGFVRANNRGILEAHGAYVLLLNSDTIVMNNAVGILAAYLDSHPEAGVCGGWLLNRDGSAQVSFGSFPSFRQALVDAFFLNDLFPAARFPNRGRIPGNRDTLPRPVDYVSGANLMIRRELIKERGLFDERFQAYCEEVDLCYRVRHDYSRLTYFVPAARIIHLGGASYGRDAKRQVRTQFASYHLFLSKHHGWMASGLTRSLFAWHFAVKLVFRLIAYALAPSAEKNDRYAGVLRAWYQVRYSLFPVVGD